MKTFFKKLQKFFLVESTKIENATFLYKPALSEPNVKINRWRVQNGSITKNEVFPVTTLFFENFISV